MILPIRKTHRAYLASALLLVMLAGCAGEPEPAPALPDTAAVATPEADTAAAHADTPLNLNTATEEALHTIPGIGDRMVHEFLEYRPYVSIQQFRREIGKYVDEAQVAAYEAYIFVPVVPDESDAETLRQLPGVDATEADALIAARPFGSNEAFLKQLAAYVSPEELAAAEHYLATP